MKLRRRCVECRKVKTVGEEIDWMVCPFDEEIYDSTEKEWHCYDCAEQCAYDV